MSQGEGGEEEIVRARQIEITDADGKVRAALAVDDNGTAALDFFDADGVRAVTLQVSEDGEARFGIGQDGHRCIYILADPEEERAGVAAIRKSGEPTDMLGIGPDGPHFNWSSVDSG